MSNLDGRERRRRIRFPVNLAANYTADRGNGVSGKGQTVNISSHGVLITSAHQLSPSTSIKVVIEWPVLLDDICPVALHIRGRVVRSEGGLIAVRYLQHELRTRNHRNESRV
jgi:hypothetical protein